MSTYMSAHIVYTHVYTHVYSHVYTHVYTQAATWVKALHWTGVISADTRDSLAAFAEVLCITSSHNYQDGSRRRRP